MSMDDLTKPFAAEDVEWRVQSSGDKGGKIWARVLAYVTNRAIMDRLDKVCGAVNWRNEYQFGPEGAVLCGLSLRVGDEWVTKWDGAENSDIEAVKGGLSGAMKRAGYQWGIGRYLYNLEEGFAQVHPSGKHFAKLKDGKTFHWDPPALPSWALPAGSQPTAKPKSPPARVDDGHAASAPARPDTRSNKSSADKVMPFGKTKGKKLGDLTDAELKGAIEWCKKTDAAKFADLIGSLAEVLADRGMPETLYDELLQSDSKDLPFA